MSWRDRAISAGAMQGAKGSWRDRAVPTDSTDQVHMDQSYQVPNAPSTMDSFARGAAQGLSLGFADEISGAVGALGDVFTSDTPLFDLYQKHRDGYRSADAAAREARPIASTVGNVVGTVPTLVAGGAIPGVAKLGLGARAALEAGVMGLGESTANDVGGMLADAGKSAVIGAGISSLGQMVAPHVQSAANKLAVTSLGPRLKHLRRMIGTDKVDEMGQMLNDEGIMRPFATAEDAYERLADKTDDYGKQIGNVIQDAADTPVFDPRQMADDLKEEIVPRLQHIPEGGKTADRITGYLDNELALKGTPIDNPNSLAPEVGVRQATVMHSGPEMPLPPSGPAAVIHTGAEIPLPPTTPTTVARGQAATIIPDPSGLTSGIEVPASPGSLVSHGGGRPPIYDHLTGAAPDPMYAPGRVELVGGGQPPIYDHLTGPAPAPITGPGRMETIGSGIPFDNRQRVVNLGDAWNLRKGIDQAIDFQKAVPDMPGFQQGLVTTRNAIQEKIVPALPEGSQELFRKYHVLEQAENIAKDTAARGMANRSISPSDYITGVGGMVYGGPVGGVVTGAVNNFLRTRGGSTGAWGLDKLSKLLSERPDAFGPFATPLVNAAKRGTQALAVTHFLLSQDNEQYRALLEKQSAE